ncbi:Lsr2 family DNA-binding protein [Nocardia sp. NPDC004123]
MSSRGRVSAEILEAYDEAGK